MSITPSNESGSGTDLVPDTSVEELDLKLQKKWWGNKKRKKAFEMFLGGIDLEKIASELGLQARTVFEWLSHENTEHRLEEEISRIYYLHQIKRIIFQDRMFEKLTHKVIDEFDKISPQQALTEIMNLTKNMKEAPIVINPRQYNIIMNATKGDKPLSQKEVEDKLGYSELPPIFENYYDNKSEESNVESESVPGGDTRMDSKEPDTDK